MTTDLTDPLPAPTTGSVAAAARPEPGGRLPLAARLATLAAVVVPFLGLVAS